MMIMLVIDAADDKSDEGDDDNDENDDNDDKSNDDNENLRCFLSRVNYGDDDVTVLLPRGFSRRPKVSDSR